MNMKIFWPFSTKKADGRWLEKKLASCSMVSCGTEDDDDYDDVAACLSSQDKNEYDEDNNDDDDENYIEAFGYDDSDCDSICKR